VPFAAPFFHEHDLVVVFVPAIVLVLRASPAALPIAMTGALFAATDWLGLAQRPDGQNTASFFSHGDTLEAAESGVLFGTPDEVAANPDSVTGAYLSGRRSIPIPTRRPIDAARTVRQDGRVVPVLELRTMGPGVSMESRPNSHASLIPHSCVAACNALIAPVLRERLEHAGGLRLGERGDQMSAEAESSHVDQVAYSSILEAMGYASNRQERPNNERDETQRYALREEGPEYLSFVRATTT